jgi:hypothetical protein
MIAHGTGERERYSRRAEDSDTMGVMPATNDGDFLDWLDSEAEAFSSETTQEYYLNTAGLKDDLALAPIFERHTELFAKKTVERIQRKQKNDVRLPNLREFVVDGFLEQAAKELTEQIAGRESSDTVEWDGERLPYRSASLRIMNEDDTARRHKLDERRVAVTSAQNALRQERWHTLYQQARELGFSNYAQLCEELGDLRLETLRSITERFLFDTEKTYRQRLESELGAIGVDPAYAERSDLARLFRQPKFDGSFPREKMLPALNATLRGLGIDPDGQPNVHVDAEERPKKSPRAFCAPVKVPDDIYLVISPHGGHDDFRALFHEAGHAQHFAHVSADQPFAFRGMGDNSVTEGFAFVMEHLLYNEEWLEHYLKISDTSEYLPFVKLHKLYFLRRYGAKLLYELELHASGDVAAMGKRYADILTAHVGVRHSPEDYLSDLDDGFYCVRYLRAWTFDAQVRRHFEQRWGTSWFLNDEAGAKLRELWSHGQRYRAEALLEQLGAGSLDISAVAAEVN